jgi:hypothetical protein
MSDIGDNKSWRCFHCDEVFTDIDLARGHFSPPYPFNQPTCQTPDLINTIMKVITEQKDQLARYIAEDSDCVRQAYSVGLQAARDIQAANDKGFADGVMEARREMAKELRISLKKKEDGKIHYADIVTELIKYE